MKKLVNYHSLLTGLLVFATWLVVPLSAALAGGLTADAGDAGGIGNIFTGLTVFIETILVPFLIALAFAFFVWGLFLYFIAGGGDEEKRGKGKSILIWSIVAFLFIVILFGVVNLIADSFGINRTGTGDGTIVVPGDISPGSGS